MTSRRFSAVYLQATKSLISTSTWFSGSLFHSPIPSQQTPKGEVARRFYSWWSNSLNPWQGRNSKFSSVLRQGSWRGGDGENVLYGLIGANAIVFAAFQLDEFRGFMFNHFTCSLQQLRNLQVYTLVTSTFSHEHFGHLAVNMLALFFFGRSLATILHGRQVQGNRYPSSPSKLSPFLDPGLASFQRCQYWLWCLLLTSRDLSWCFDISTDVYCSF